MDFCKSEKKSLSENTREPLVPKTDGGKNVTTRRSRIREVSSRYRSPTPSRITGPICSASPSINGVSSATSSTPIPKRAVSAERRHSITPSSSPRSSSPSTPVKITMADIISSSRKILRNKAPESLWPSAVRSLNVSFQSDDGYHVSGNKRDKLVADKTLRSSSNAVLERKKSPFKGKSNVDRSENAKPVDNLLARLVDQHRWPGRTSGKSKNTDSVARRSNNLYESGISKPSARRLSLDGMDSEPLQRSARDLLMLISSSQRERGKHMSNSSLIDDNSLRVRRHGSVHLSDRTTPLVNHVGKSQSLPGSRPSSPSVSRRFSPNRVRTMNPSSRGISPARVRPSSPSRQPQNSSSVLSFIVDIKRGTKTASHIEDVHQLRLLYNRHLQWRYANARSDALLRSHKIKAEQMLYRVWRKIVELLESVIKKRFDLHELRLKLALYSILNNQITYLDEWDSIEMDHTCSLTWAIRDLQACTIQIPVTGGAKVDIESLKKVVSYCVDVMQGLGYTLSPILSRVERTNSSFAELARVAALERAMLDECEALLSSIAVLQVEENRLRTYLLQMEQVLAKW